MSVFMDVKLSFIVISLVYLMQVLSPSLTRIYSLIRGSTVKPVQAHLVSDFSDRGCVPSFYYYPV